MRMMKIEAIRRPRKLSAPPPGPQLSSSERSVGEGKASEIVVEDMEGTLVVLVVGLKVDRLKGRVDA